MEFELKSISLGEQRKKSVILDLFFFKHLKNNKIKIILHTLNIYLPHQLFIETVRYIFIPQINTTSKITSAAQNARPNLLKIQFLYINANIHCYLNY